MHTELSSSQAFIRALKGPSDPPSPGGLSKVELAREAWALDSLFIPSKAEVIVEWALQSLLHSSANSPEQVILSEKLWRLLADITRQTSGTTNWINRVVNRVPVLPIFAALLHALRQTLPLTPGDSLRPVLDSATDVAHVLLPLASLKASCDVVATCFWQVTGLFSTRDIPHPDLLSTLDLCERITSTFESSFGNHSNKKKIAALLVEKHLSSWLLSAQNPACHPALVTFAQRLFDLGQSVVFCPEYTRVVFQAPETHPVLLATVSSPRLFGAYVSALRAHKRVIFSDQPGSIGGVAKRIRGAARALFVQTVSRGTWPVIAQLAQAAEELQVVDDEWADDVQRLVESATGALTKPWTDEQARIATHVCATLACIVRLHIDAVLPRTELLLSSLCTAPASVLPSARAVLELLLDHHSKARTLDTYLPQLTGSLAPRDSVLAPREHYRAACIGPVLDPRHLAKLRRSISAFITPGQIPPCIAHLLAAFATAVATLSPLPEPPRKKQKTAHGEIDESHAIHIGLVSRLLTHILASVPVQTLKPDRFESLRVSVDEFDAGALADAVAALGTGLERSWARQTMSAAVLRVRYGLRQGRCPVQTRCAPRVEENGVLLGLVEDSALSAELVTEIVRILTQGQRPREHLHTVWSLALGRLRSSADEVHTEWNGSLAHLDDVWFPLWFLLLDRQLDVIDSSLGPDQLRSMLDMFVHLNRDPTTSDSICSIHLFQKAISSARFWEMPNIRRILNEKVSSDTESLDNVDFHKALKAMRKGKHSKHAGSHDAAISIYHLAALCPPDYLDRSVKAALLARAPCADVLAAHPKDRAAVRVVLRQLSAGNTMALSGEYVQYLLDPHLRHVDSSNVNDTLGTLETSFRVYARLAKDTGAQGDLGAVLQYVSILGLFKAPLWGSPEAELPTRALLHLLDIIPEIWASTTLPEDIRIWMLRILDQIRNCVEEWGTISNRLIEAARVLASCEHWLQLGSPPGSCRTRRLLRALAQDNSVATEALLRLITEEIRHLGEDVRLLVATLAIYVRSHNTGAAPEMEKPFGEACRRLNPEQHASLTSELISLLLEPENNSIYRIATIRMTSLALRYAPEGTSKARRRSTTAALHSLAQTPRLQALQEACAIFVSELCSERANALTVPDMTAIWILLDRAMTSTDEIILGVYSPTVGSLNSLVRFRRDLLTPALAQLSALLARLIRTLKLRMSHAIGVRQRSAEEQASLAEKATELARLLVGLTTKNAPATVRGKVEQKQTTKAESLARPFARHAPYLLVAYADSAADMSTAVRAALKPGLFALCEMSGVPARDMIMVTMLDTVEKEVFAGIWREWEAQKYAGKG